MKAGFGNCVLIPGRCVVTVTTLPLCITGTTGLRQVLPLTQLQPTQHHQPRSATTGASGSRDALPTNSAVVSVGSVDSRWFQSQLALNRLSQRRLAKLIGLDPSAVSLMFRGKRRMTAEEAAMVSRLLNVDVQEVMTRAGIDLRGVLGVLEAPTAKGGEVGVEPPAPPQPSVFVTRNNSGNSEKSALIEIPVPISGGFTAFLKIPRELSKADAERIAAIIVAFSQQN